jgi:GxxExxY protein
MSIIRKTDLLYPELSYQLIGCAFDVYESLGSGHLEKYYQRAYAESLKIKTIEFKEQSFHPLKFNNKVIGKMFFDFLIEKIIIVELKKDNKFSKQRIDQLLQYLRGSGLKLGILINFSSSGVMYKRIINI